MKGNKKILVVVAFLLLLTLTFTSYAIYKSSLTANSTVNAAAWNVAFKDGSNEITTSYNITFNATDCPGNTHTANNVIAPGASCTKTISVDATGTQVDVAVTATPGTPTVGGTAISGANTFTATATVTGSPILYSANDQTATVTVTITWGGEEGEEYDEGDTGLAGQTITVPVTLTAKQVVGS